MSALPRSLEPLALLAMKQAGAEGYAICEVDTETGPPKLKLAGGTKAPETDAEGFTVSSHPLRAGKTAGILTFVFRGAIITPDSHATIERIARVIEEVWRSSLVADTYAQKAARIGALETELADSKIAERACGLLADGPSNRGAIDTIVRHVESVLRPSELANTLGQFERELAEELAERQVTSRAKAVLQSRYGISEEQAHVHLRQVSRTSRRRLREVAQALIENPALYARRQVSEIHAKP